MSFSFSSLCLCVCPCMQGFSLSLRYFDFLCFVQAPCPSCALCMCLIRSHALCVADWRCVGGWEEAEHRVGSDQRGRFQTEEQESENSHRLQEPLPCQRGL